MSIIIKGINLPKEVGDVISINLYDKKDNWLDNIEVYRKDIIQIDLVRCKDCKHYGFKETDRGGFPCCTNVIGATPYRMPTDFCSYGERRTDDKTEESRP